MLEMKTLILFVGLLLPLFVAAQISSPSRIFGDTRSLALGENDCAAEHYAPIDSTLHEHAWQWQTYVPYLQGALWQNTLSYQYQKSTGRLRCDLALDGRDWLRLGVRTEHLFSDYWQAGLALHYGYWTKACASASLLEGHCLYRPRPYWQIHVLLWHLAWWQKKDGAWQSGFQLAGMYENESISLCAALAYDGKQPVSSHYGLAFKFEKVSVQLGCSLPQARPSVGVSWPFKQLRLASALVYDWHLGLSARLGISYHYRHE